MMMSDKEKWWLFNWSILAHISVYLEKGFEEYNGNELDPTIYKLRQKAHSLSVIHRINPGEVKYLQDITTDEFEERMNTDIAFIIFALHLAKLYIELIPKKKRYDLNISKAKIQLANSRWVVPMLQAKNQYPEIYQEKKEIMNDSRDLAEYFFNFMYENIIGGKNELQENNAVKS
jgi:hypothetical protein